MSTHERTEQHVRDFFEGHDVSLTAWLPGPSARLWPSLYYLAVAPGPRYSGWVYFSVGASQVSEKRLEFFVCSPHATESMIELLAMVVHYHATEHLDINHTLPIGRAWLPGSSCDHLLVTLPYPFGPRLENVFDAPHEIRALWLLPITASEKAYAKANGPEALESRFDEEAINPLDPGRSSVV